MATLEKIRSKSVLLFTIIIVALLAFILGDFLTSSRSYFGTGDTVASVNGVKVDYNTYREAINKASEQQKNNNQNVDNDVLAQQTINDLLIQALLEREYDNLGITVTDKQLQQLMFGDNAPYVYAMLMQQFGQYAGTLQQKGIIDVNTFSQAMNAPAKFGLDTDEANMMKSVWLDAEKNFDQQLRQSAYGVLIQGLFTANKVDAKALYNDRNTTSHFAYARKDFSAIPDKDVKLTDEDYQNLYDEHKGAYKINEEQRAVKYIVVPVTPSDADFMAGQKEVETVVAQLKDSEGTKALDKHPMFSSQTAKFTRASLAKNPALRSLAIDSIGLSAGEVRVVRAIGGNYTLAKVLDVTSGIDNLKMSFLPAMAADMDSLAKSLNVANFDSLARANGGTADYAMSLVTPNIQLNEKQLESLKTQPVGQIFYLNDTVQTQGQDGKSLSQVLSVAFLIKERDAAVPVYDIAQIDYVVEPSAKTVQDLNTKFNAFVANNATAEAFAKEAEKAGYQIADAMVSNSTPLVGMAPASRGAVKWAMKNDKGDVSPVMTFKAGTGYNSDYLIAVAIDDVFDGAYIPVTAKLVRDQLKPYVLNEKKAKMLIDRYKGKAKDLNGYAKAMGTEVAQADAIFGEDQIPQLGFGEFNVQGQVAGAQKGKLVGPFKGNNAIYVVTVNGSDVQGRPYDFAENQQAFTQKYLQGMFGNNFLELLVGNNKVKNNSLEFIADETND